MPEAPRPLLRLQDVDKVFDPGKLSETRVLHGVSLEVARGEFVALVGPSGSGKSTLLNLIGLLDRPTRGTIELLGQQTSELDDGSRTRLRAEHIGFIFQFHHLIPAFTARENVLLPLMLRGGRPNAAARAWADELLATVGLSAVADRRPGQLSGGQQQRVAVARALVARPALLLADEPTGNLDTEAADAVFHLLRDFRRRLPCAVILVTHDTRLARRCERTIELVDGRIHRDAATSQAGRSLSSPDDFR